MYNKYNLSTLLGSNNAQYIFSHFGMRKREILSQVMVSFSLSILTKRAALIKKGR